MSKENPGWDFLSKPDGGFIDGDDGDSYKYSDGSGYYHGVDGSEGYIYSDGSGYFHGADGTDAYIYSDGSGYYHGADGSDGHRYSDGSGYFHGGDGSDGRRYSDGSGYFNGGNGSSRRFEIDSNDNNDNNSSNEDYDIADVLSSINTLSALYGSYSNSTSYTTPVENYNDPELKAKYRRNRITFLIVIILLVVSFLSWKWWKNYAYTNTPISSSECIGKDYKIIAQQFEDAGFKEIKIIPVEDLKDGWIIKDTNKVETVQSISIDGSTKFRKNKEYRKDDKVTIYYHVYPSGKD